MKKKKERKKEKKRERNSKKLSTERILKNKSTKIKLYLTFYLNLLQRPIWDLLSIWDGPLCNNSCLIVYDDTINVAGVLDPTLCIYWLLFAFLNGVDIRRHVKYRLFHLIFCWGNFSLVECFREFLGEWY